MGSEEVNVLLPVSMRETGQKHEYLAAGIALGREMARSEVRRREAAMGGGRRHC